MQQKVLSLRLTLHGFLGIDRVGHIARTGNHVDTHMHAHMVHFTLLFTCKSYLIKLLIDPFLSLTTLIYLILLCCKQDVASKSILLKLLDTFTCQFTDLNKWGLMLLSYIKIAHKLTGTYSIH